jgi:hypothetical protein
MSKDDIGLWTSIAGVGAEGRIEAERAGFPQRVVAESDLEIDSVVIRDS